MQERKHHQTPPAWYYTGLIYPHLPSFQPSFHLSFHRAQSNSGLPSFTLTALCALHIQKPKTSLPSTRGSLPGAAIQSRRSSAHTEHGYSSEKRVRNRLVLDLVSSGAEVGYEAAMLCSRVQVERPSSSTSGGQSGGDVAVDVASVTPPEDVWALVIATHAANDVHVRQLEIKIQLLKWQEEAGMYVLYLSW